MQMLLLTRTAQKWFEVAFAIYGLLPVTVFWTSNKDSIKILIVYDVHSNVVRS